LEKAYELSTLTGTQVMLLVASETGHVYTFATEKLKPIITSEAGKTLIQSCLNNGNVNSNGNAGGLNGSSLSNEKISIENFDEFDEDDEYDEEEDDLYYEEEDEEEDNYDVNNIENQDNDNVNMNSNLSVLQHQSADSSLIIDDENSFVDRLNKYYSNIYSQNGGVSNDIESIQLNTSNSNNNSSSRLLNDSNNKVSC
jgi:hypothetical protein